MRSGENNVLVLSTLKASDTDIPPTLTDACKVQDTKYFIQ